MENKGGPLSPCLQIQVPCLQIQGEIYTHSELLRTSGVRRGGGVNKSVNRGLPGSQGELGRSKGTVSGRVKAVVGSILVAQRIP